MQVLAELLRLKLKRDKDGEHVLTGKSGNIHAGRDGYWVYIASSDGNRRRTAESFVKHARGRVTQRGDTEIVGWIPKTSLKSKNLKTLCDFCGFTPKPYIVTT